MGNYLPFFFSCFYEMHTSWKCKKGLLCKNDFILNINHTLIFSAEIGWCENLPYLKKPCQKEETELSRYPWHHFPKSFCKEASRSLTTFAIQLFWKIRKNPLRTRLEQRSHRDFAVYLHNTFLQAVSVQPFLKRTTIHLTVLHWRKSQPRRELEF